MRFFRSQAAAYEQARATLDAALGFPSAVAETAIDPEAVAPHDGEGRVLLAMNDTLCGDPAVAAVLPCGMEEISEDEYRTSLPQPAGP